MAFSTLHGSVSSADDSSGSSPPLRTDRDTQSPQTADSSDEDRQHVSTHTHTHTHTYTHTHTHTHARTHTHTHTHTRTMVNAQLLLKHLGMM